MRALMMVCCLLVAPLAAADTVLQAWAYINLEDVPPRAVSRDGSPVSSSAAGSGSSASASASETSVSARADSQDANLVEGAHAIASTHTTFKVTGGNGSVSLTFNLGVSGSIYAHSSPIPGNGPNVSVVAMHVRSNVDRAEANGGILMGSQHGVLVIHSASGTFEEGGAGEGVFRADVDVRLSDPRDAIPFALLRVLGHFNIIGSTLPEILEKIENLITFIEGTAAILGFPDLDIAPGEVVPVFQVQYFVDNNLPITVPIVPNDGRTHSMALTIQAQASSSPVASGSSNYSNTFEVKSVTVDPAYEGDPSEIVVTFESGKTMRATREGSRRRAVRH